MASIAAVSTGGRYDLVGELQHASLKAGGDNKANLVKVEKVDGKDCWRNPNAAEQRGVGSKGKLVYDGGGDQPLPR